MCKSGFASATLCTRRDTGVMDAIFPIECANQDFCLRARRDDGVMGAMFSIECANQAL